MSPRGCEVRYAVLFPSNPEDNEGRSWAIVDAAEPTEAAKMAKGGAATNDEKALVIELNKPPIPLYAIVAWSQ